MDRLLCEEKIPYARDAFRSYGDVTLCKGNRITAEDLNCIDILMIRSGTRVDSDLLDGTPVRFVASATAGTDHVDLEYLALRNTPFYHAPGCNADSVVEYVIAALFHLAGKYNESLEGKRVGIVGAGNVGGRLAHRLRALGLRVLVNDRPLFGAFPDALPDFERASLNEVLAKSDVVTLHTPLTYRGPNATFHLIDEPELCTMKAGAWLINASRGAVVSNAALKHTLSDNHLGAVVLDVWEGEPRIDIELLDRVDIGTPHIAGYSYDGKVNGTIQIYQAFVEHHGFESKWDPERILRPTSEDHLELTSWDPTQNEEANVSRIVEEMYDIEADDRRFRKIANMPAQECKEYFWHLRKTYPRRRSFHWFELRCEPVVSENVIDKLNFGLKIETGN